MNFLLRLIISAIVAFGLSYVLPGIHIDSFITALLVAFVLALLNGIVKPILIVLTLPITLITLGLFLFVINAFMIMLGTKLVNGFTVDGFWWALLFSILLSIVSSFLYSVSKKEG
jgi:putative membrane protein